MNAGKREGRIGIVVAVVVVAMTVAVAVRHGVMLARQQSIIRECVAAGGERQACIVRAKREAPVPKMSSSRR